MTGDDVAAAARALVAQARWLALATVTDAGDPALSYVPFAPVRGAFGIVVSALAAHSARLTVHPHAAVLLVGPAGDDAFARPRVSVDVVARAAEDPAAAAAIWAALAGRHGATVEVLRMLPDFRPLLLEPLRAHAVLGFGAAADVDAHALGLGSE